ncbi:putative phage baseplate assembly protein [Luteibacter rhizovicinus]|uniref:Putative phage baseplate assembly protein n=1 Tax=Luteibacter rhizovicinus TaxID=242606 RepID=A0A4R3YP56_9GAMM|nr:putative baseplate assembly protein [Luteibacter rhizovicinus]TCV94665.1 putative phage baseplate assembly protein [Luteibacter rhizovicinus]
MIYRCCTADRRERVLNHSALNGLDYLEVIDHDLADTDPLRQRTLLVHFLKPLPAGFSAKNVRLTGGERIVGIAIEWAGVASPTPLPLASPLPPDTAAAEAGTLAVIGKLADATSTLIVRTAVAGDFSTYTLNVVASPTVDTPPAGFDPQLSRIDFAFKVQCPTDFDCKPPDVCIGVDGDIPDIDYLAKDYPSFRRLMLDRLAQLVPAWEQSSEADFGMAVTELMAYAYDQLSYQQDAASTEGYFSTARRRISLRRHATLVDYPMHDGCNARAWVHVRVAGTVALPLAGTRFLTRCTGFPAEIPVGPVLDDAMRTGPLVFEAMLDPMLQATGYIQTLRSEHNQVSFYTWSESRCCLPSGATSATLAGSLMGLAVGDVMVFEERIGPHTGQPGDADISHRHVVRLTAVDATGKDPVEGTLITQIAWAGADALPFALCISEIIDGKPCPDVSVARGNMVLVDHGQSFPEGLDTAHGEDLGVVPSPTLFTVDSCCDDPCNPRAPKAIPPRYRPSLQRTPLTQAAGKLVDTGGKIFGTQPDPYDPKGPASAAVKVAMEQVLPQVHLIGTLDAHEHAWEPRRSLLGSNPVDRHVVVEVDERARASFRYGDDNRAMRAAPMTAFAAWYRTGNGTAGNVGADSIAHVVAGTNAIDAVRNPCPATGGVDAEDAESVRQRAPFAFRTQQRAVTMDDYAHVAERDPRIQRAAASLRWTGSWYTVQITPDAIAGADVKDVKDKLPALIDLFRMAGQDVSVNDPHYIPLEVALHICVKPDYFRSDVRQQLLLTLGNRRLPDGGMGLFHADNYSFGQSVYLSGIYKAAHDVPGVASVQVTTFQRQGTNDATYLLDGRLPIGPFEIARLDNDPNYPERGVLRLDVHGGK